VQLDPQLRSILAAIRRQIRQYIVADSLLAISALVLLAFWIGLLVDFTPVRLGGTEMPRSARVVLLVAVAAAALFLFFKLLIGRLRKPLRDDSVALLVERHHPELRGSLVTAVQLTQSGRRGDSHDASLLEKVHDEASLAVPTIQTNRIFRWQPIYRKIALVAPLGVAAIVFAIVSPSAFGRAAGRLLLLTDSPWPRRASLAMVGVELPAVTVDENDMTPPVLIPFDEQVIRLPQGSSGTLRIAAKADGAVVPDVCTVYYATDAGTRGQANMRRIGRVTDGEQAFILDGPPLAGLTESVWISVRGLDSRLDDFRIEAVAPPAITSMQIQTTDPAYLKAADATEPARRTTDYQSGLRIREGSTVRMTGKSTLPLGDVAVRLVRGNEPATDAKVTIENNGLGFAIDIADMRQPATVIVVPEDKTGITAQLPYRYFLGVVVDDDPAIEMRLRGIGTAVTPNARIPITGSAKDDYGIDESRVIMTDATSNIADDATVEPAENGVATLETPPPGSSATIPMTLDREGGFELTIDLRAMAESGEFVVPDPESKEVEAAVTLFGEVSDAFDLVGEHRTKTEIYRLQVVTAERLLMLLERRELGLRARLEQAIDETRSLRDFLDLLRREAVQEPEKTDVAELDDAPADEPSTSVPLDRRQQIMRLRAQQSGLQATKTSDELSGIAESLDDLLVEMQNNRIDSVDRSERIGTGVRDPLRLIVAGDLSKLREEIASTESLAGDLPKMSESAAQAVKTAEDVVIQLTAVLEKMLDLESYNEILDMVRELIDSQNSLIDETKTERTQRTRGLFE